MAHVLDSSLMFRSVRDRLAYYGDQVDHWRRDHERAMHCLEFELLLEQGLSLLTQVNHIDEKIRLKIFRGELEHDPAFDNLLRDFYTGWLNPCQTLINELDAFESEGFAVERAEEFRDSCREVRGILTDDRDFFQGDALSDLRDEAIDEHRADLKPVLSD